jgi:primosomal protein N' (replication factor Y)
VNNFALICADIPHSDVDRLFHYIIPEGLTVTAGMRVRVPFGRSIKVGYVMDMTSEPPTDIPLEKVKEIHGTCDDFPVLTAETIKLAHWLHEKYYTTLAACIRAIVPSAKADGRFAGTRTAQASAAAPLPIPIVLTDEQEGALSRIEKIIDGGSSPSPLLLHGVTGSGKTEIYLRAIEKILKLGRQAIVLVPEIALTPQMVGLFSARFGSAAAVTHSRLTQGERFKVWKQALDSEIQLVIGPRSAVFAPFPRLGLIVVDEEHEHTYHSETSPKYDAREVAVKRGKLCGAAVILGSATPSLDSYLKASEGIYSLAELSERVNKTLPEIHIIDMRKEMARGNTSAFSIPFREALRETLDAGQQAILFLNRRGYSSFVSCRWCGHVMTCENCRVNHTYHGHRDKGRLLCHYCGKGVALPEKCPACASEHIRRYGTGTQKVEEEMAELFPDTKILRMDTDTTRGKHGHAKVLDSFRKGEAQILIGTQMVAKGLDFPKVTMVGVVAADMSLHTGDFRAGEYTFQLLTQVAGRAGRAEDTGRVFIQTYNPEHYAISLAENGDYKKFFRYETGLRHAMNYPPYSHVFSVMFTGANEREVIDTLRKLSAIMEYCAKRDYEKHGTNRFEIIGLSPAFVSMIKRQYRWKLLIKCADESSLVAFVLYCIKKLKENDTLKNITAQLTLNPRIME